MGKICDRFAILHKACVRRTIDSIAAPPPILGGCLSRCRRCDVRAHADLRWTCLLCPTPLSRRTEIDQDGWRSPQCPRYPTFRERSTAFNKRFAIVYKVGVLPRQNGYPKIGSCDLLIREERQ